MSFEYMNEGSIDPDLICNICQLPLTDPCCTPCRETYCRGCITTWIQQQDPSCPHCRELLTVNALSKVPRSLQNMLDRLQIQCTICGRKGLQRINFEDHIQKECIKAIVHCPAADIKCPWSGERDHLNKHLNDCRFEAMRPVIKHFINEKQELQLQVNQQTTEIFEQQNQIQQLTQLVDGYKTRIHVDQYEKQQLKKQIADLNIQVNTYRGEYQQLNEQLKQQLTQITLMSDQLRKSINAYINAFDSLKKSSLRKICLSSVLTLKGTLTFWSLEYTRLLTHLDIFVTFFSGFGEVPIFSMH